MTTPALGGLLGSGGGSVVGGAVVRLFLDDGQFNAALAQAEGKTKGATTGMSAGFSKLKAVGQAALIALAVGAVKFAADSVRAFEEAEAVEAKLAVAYKGNTDALKAQALALQEWSGFSDEAVLSADAVYARLGLQEAQIRSLIPVTLDFARATGQDVVTSATAMSKALLGSTRALKTVGISSQEFVVTGNHAADAAKLVSLLNSKIGGTAQALSQSLPVKLEVLHNKINELQESVGQALVPALIDLASSASRLVTDAGPLISVFFEGVATAAQTTADVVSGLLDGFDALASALPGVDSNAEAAANGGVSSLSQALNLLGSLQKDATVRMDALVASVATGIGATDKLTNSQQDYNTVGTEAVAILEAQKTAEDALAGGLLGLIASLKSVAADQKALNDLRRKGKTDSAAYRDAELQLLQDQESFKASLDGMIAKMGDAQASTKDVKDRIVELGHEVGISKGDVLVLAHDALGALSSGAGTATGKVDALGRSIDSLHDKKVTVDVYTVYHDPKNPQQR